MKKAVLISMKPKNVELVLNGYETLEIRKTRPRLETPFKCYIYCTNSGVAMGMWGKHGKVVGEFTCNKVTNLFSNSRFWLNEDDVLRTCLSAAEMRKYANGANGLYGWHISDLKIYDKPRELREFKKNNRDCFYADIGIAKRDCPDCKNSGCFLERPPRSWYYVEDLA